MNMVDRTLLLSYPQFHTKNLIEPINILINDGYPLKLIFSIINSRIKFFSISRIKQYEKEELSRNNEKKQFFTIPYVKNISENFKRIAKKYAKFSFLYHKFSFQIHKKEKDQLNALSRCNVVYRINCSNCEASYVGQTKDD